MAAKPAESRWWRALALPCVVQDSKAGGGELSGGLKIRRGQQRGDEQDGGVANPLRFVDGGTPRCWDLDEMSSELGTRNDPYVPPPGGRLGKVGEGLADGRRGCCFAACAGVKKKGESADAVLPRPSSAATPSSSFSKESSSVVFLAFFVAGVGLLACKPKDVAAQREIRTRPQSET